MGLLNNPKLRRITDFILRETGHQLKVLVWELLCLYTCTLEGSVCKTGSWGKKKMPPPRAGVLWVFLFSKQPWGWRQSRMNQSEDLQTHTLSRFSHVRLCDPMDSSPPGSSVHEILQARILEWVAVPSSRDSSQPWDQTCISFVSCIGRRALYRTT